MSTPNNTGPKQEMWAHITFPKPDGTFAEVPVSKILWKVSPKPPVGTRTYTKYEPENTADYSKKQLYCVKYDYKGEEGPYFCYILKMAESKEKLMEMLQTKRALMASQMETHLSEPDVSGSERANGSSKPNVVVQQRESTKKIAQNVRTSQNEELKRTLLSNGLLAASAGQRNNLVTGSSSQFHSVDRLLPESTLSDVSQQSFHAVAEVERPTLGMSPPRPPTLLQPVSNPDDKQEIDRLNRLLHLKESELQLMKENAVAELNEKQLLLNSIKDIVQEELKSNNEAWDRKFEEFRIKLSEGGSEQNCKLRLSGKCRDYIQAWINSLNDDFNSDLI